MLWIIYSVLIVVYRTGGAGLSLIDSLPVMFYLLPLFIILPLVLREYHRNNAAVLPVAITCGMSFFYLVFSVLIRFFIVMFVLNLPVIAFMIITGDSPPKKKLKDLSKKGLIWFIFLNVIGLLFPASVVVMGQTSIASVNYSAPPEVVLDVPLIEWDYPYENITPTEQLLNTVHDNNFSLSFRLDTEIPEAMARALDWFVVINNTNIGHDITFDIVLTQISVQSRRSTKQFDTSFANYVQSFNAVMDLLETNNITRLPRCVYFDLLITRQDWQSLLASARTINLIGFSLAIRTIVEGIDDTHILNATRTLVETVHSRGVSAGVLVDSLVIDDLQDSDTLFMKYCGVTTDSLVLWDRVQYYAGRSRFSFEMNGDVGRYLIYSYSRTIGMQSNDGELRMGVAGRENDKDGRLDDIYGTLGSLVDDIKIAAGNGIRRITVESLPFILKYDGEPLNGTMSALQIAGPMSTSYTFRIYAFRAVFALIDSFDPLMF